MIRAVASSPRADWPSTAPRSWLTGKSHSRAGFSGKGREGMNSTKQAARIAGVLYLVNGVTGFFGIVYVPSKLIVSGNTAATTSNILASERLFRLGIVSEL